MDDLTRRSFNLGMLSRRRFLSLAVAGVAGTAAASLLAACGGGSSTSEATTASTSTSAGAATSPSGASTPAGSGASASPAGTTAAATQSATTSSGTAKKGGSLRIAYAAEPKNLHPQIDSGTEGVYIQMQVYDSLVNVDPNGKIIPGLATALPEQPDDKTYIFHLRQNVKFHNGKPFTADDVVWTFDRLLGKFPDLQSTQAARFGGQIASVEKVDDATIKITMKQPWSDFMILMAADKYMRIQQKDAEIAAGKEYGQTVVVGTGPFKFKEWNKGDHLTIVRNDDYWGDPAYLDQIIYKAIPEDATRMAAFDSGDIDVLFAPALKDVKKYETDSKFKVLTADAGNIKNLSFNTTRDPFKDAKVRQALYYGINREEIVDGIYHGYAAVGQGILPPWNPANDPSKTYYPYDPDKAKQLLSEAGYSSSKPLEFEITTANATEFTDLSTLIQAQLETIGVKATVTPLDASAYTAKTFPTEVGHPNPGFQASVYRLIYGFPTTDYGWRTYHPQSALDTFGYNQEGGVQNPEVVTLLDQSTQVTDVAKQKEIYSKLSDLIMADAPWVLLAIQKNVLVSHAAVKDLTVIVISNMPLKGVWLDK
jgi:peptide/nickel transport system substrate-binding protein